VLTPPTLRSGSIALSLDEVLRRLARRDIVDGVIVIGSVAKDALTAASDYDLYVVLSSMPAPLHVGLTWIDHRLTDVVFERTPVIDRYLAQEDILPADDGQERLARYATTGRIVVDRHGRLERVRDKVGQASASRPTSDAGMHSVWFAVNYNLRQTERMLASDDPVYVRAVDMRLLYSTAEVVTAYFVIRRLPWRGDKAAIRYLAAHDVDMLRAFEEFADAADRAGKMRAYERLAALALAPLGGVWPDGATALEFEGAADVSAETVERALDFWEDLLKG